MIKNKYFIIMLTYIFISLPISVYSWRIDLQFVNNSKSTIEIKNTRVKCAHRKDAAQPITLEPGASKQVHFETMSGLHGCKVSKLTMKWQVLKKVDKNPKSKNINLVLAIRNYVADNRKSYYLVPEQNDTDAEWCRYDSGNSGNCRKSTYGDNEFPFLFPKELNMAFKVTINKFPKKK